MKARDLLPIIERVRRSTSNNDVVTICDALQSRVVREMADAATSAPSAKNNAPALPTLAPSGLPKRRGPAGTAIAAALERAEDRSKKGKAQQEKHNRKARRRMLGSQRRLAAQKETAS